MLPKYNFLSEVSDSNDFGREKILLLSNPNILRDRYVPNQSGKNFKLLPLKLKDSRELSFFKDSGNVVKLLFDKLNFLRFNRDPIQFGRFFNLFPYIVRDSSWERDYDSQSWSCNQG